MITVSLISAAGISAQAYDSNAYSWDESPLGVGSLRISGISAVTNSDVWAVGRDSTPSGLVYHFNGTAWSHVNTWLWPFNGVSALDSNHVWVVGDSGRIFFYNGSTWISQTPSPSATFSFKSVFALNADHVYAVGTLGTIYRYDGSAWHDESISSTDELDSVYAFDESHIRAVGSNGLACSNDGTSWTTEAPFTTTNFRSVFSLDTNRVWVVGDGGKMWFFDGNAWSDRSSELATADDLRSVYALDTNHILIAGASGSVHYWDGTLWNTSATSATPPHLYCVTALDPRHVYVGADNGSIYTGRISDAARAQTFYFAEGTCRPNFDSYICIQNPDQLAANVTITYMLGNGTVQDQPLTIPGRSRTTVRASDVLGSGDDEAHDFSARVHCTSGTNIVAERPMYFNYKGAWTGGHDVVGALNPQQTFYFAEGSCRPQFDPYLCIQNPGSTAADVQITYMRGDGSIAGEILNVPANKRSTVVVKNTLGTGDDDAHDFSAKVETTNGTSIVAERPMYFNYKGEWTGGHDVVGTPVTGRKFYFAEGSCRPGFNSYICIQNPGDSPAMVVVDYYLGDGSRDRQGVEISPGTRETLNVNDKLGTADDAAHDFSAVVYTTDGNQIVVERPMYFNYQGTKTGGHDVVGALYPAGTYYFAEGTCRPDFDPYICIQNPGTRAVPVRITYMLGSGGPQTQDVNVPAGSRYTVSVKGFLGSADDPAHDFSAQVTSRSARHDAIVVERPMYFNYGGAWTGGHDVVGYTP